MEGPKTTVPRRISRVHSKSESRVTRTCVNGVYESLLSKPRARRTVLIVLLQGEEVGVPS